MGMYFRKRITIFLNQFYTFIVFLLFFFIILIFILTSDHDWIRSGASSCVLELINTDKDSRLAHVADECAFWSRSSSTVTLTLLWTFM